MSPTTKPPQVHWQDATASTVDRIQQIFGLDETLDGPAKRELYTLAEHIVATQGRANNGATEYWNTFVNVLRTLVAGSCECNPKQLPF